MGTPSTCVSIVVYTRDSYVDTQEICKEARGMLLHVPLLIRPLTDDLVLCRQSRDYAERRRRGAVALLHGQARLRARGRRRHLQVREPWLTVLEGSNTRWAALAYLRMKTHRPLSLLLTIQGHQECNAGASCRWVKIGRAHV